MVNELTECRGEGVGFFEKNKGECHQFIYLGKKMAQKSNGFQVLNFVHSENIHISAQWVTSHATVLLPF